VLSASPERALRRDIFTPSFVKDKVRSSKGAHAKANDFDGGSGTGPGSGPRVCEISPNSSRDGNGGKLRPAAVGRDYRRRPTRNLAVESGSNRDGSGNPRRYRQRRSARGGQQNQF